MCFLEYSVLAGKGQPTQVRLLNWSTACQWGPSKGTWYYGRHYLSFSKKILTEKAKCIACIPLINTVLLLRVCVLQKVRKGKVLTKCWCAWPLQLPIIKELIFWIWIHFFPCFSLCLVIKRKGEENLKKKGRKCSYYPILPKTHYQVIGKMFTP